MANKMKIDLNIANQITIGRIIAIPVFLIVIYLDNPWSNGVACFIFALASFSDMLDGYLARKYNLVSDFGKVMDPMADKILVAAAMIALVELDRLAGWVVVVMLARDFIIGALRDLSASKGIIIPAGLWGKLKTTVQMLAVGMLTFKSYFIGVDWLVLGTYMMYFALILSIYSGYVYLKQYLFSNEGIK